MNQPPIHHPQFTILAILALLLAAILPANADPYISLSGPATATNRVELLHLTGATLTFTNRPGHAANTSALLTITPGGTGTFAGVGGGILTTTGNDVILTTNALTGFLLTLAGTNGFVTASVTNNLATIAALNLKLDITATNVLQRLLIAGSNITIAPFGTISASGGGGGTNTLFQVTSAGDNRVNGVLDFQGNNATNLNWLFDGNGTLSISVHDHILYDRHFVESVDFTSRQLIGTNLNFAMQWAENNHWLYDNAGQINFNFNGSPFSNTTTAVWTMNPADGIWRVDVVPGAGSGLSSNEVIGIVNATNDAIRADFPVSVAEAGHATNADWAVTSQTSSNSLKLGGIAAANYATNGSPNTIFPNDAGYLTSFTELDPAAIFTNGVFIVGRGSWTPGVNSGTLTILGGGTADFSSGSGTSTLAANSTLFNGFASSWFVATNDSGYLRGSLAITGTVSTATVTLSTAGGTITAAVGSSVLLTSSALDAGSITAGNLALSRLPSAGITTNAIRFSWANGLLTNYNDTLTFTGSLSNQVALIASGVVTGTSGYFSAGGGGGADGVGPTNAVYYLHALGGMIRGTSTASRSSADSSRVILDSTTATVEWQRPLPFNFSNANVAVAIWSLFPAATLSTATYEFGVSPGDGTTNFPSFDGVTNLVIIGNAAATVTFQLVGNVFSNVPAQSLASFRLKYVSGATGEVSVVGVKHDTIP